MSTSANGGGIGDAFTPLTLHAWLDLMALADEAVTSPQAQDRLRLAILDLAPGVWVRERNAVQAERIRPTDNPTAAHEPDDATG